MKSIFNNSNKKLLVPLDVINSSKYPSLNQLNLDSVCHTKNLHAIVTKKNQINTIKKNLQPTELPNYNSPKSSKTPLEMLQEIINPPNRIIIPQNTINIPQHSITQDKPLIRIPGPKPPNFPPGHRLPHIWVRHKVICVEFYIRGNLIRIPVGHLTSRNLPDSIFISNLSYDKPIPMFIRPYRITDPTNLIFLEEKDILISEVARTRFDQLYLDQNEHLLILTHDSYEQIANMLADLAP